MNLVLASVTLFVCGLIFYVFARGWWCRYGIFGINVDFLIEASATLAYPCFLYRAHIFSAAFPTAFFASIGAIGLWWVVVRVGWLLGIKANEIEYKKSRVSKQLRRRERAWFPE